MHRSCLLILGLLLIAAPVLGQSASTDSQTLQALLSKTCSAICLVVESSPSQSSDD